MNNFETVPVSSAAQWLGHDSMDTITEHELSLASGLSVKQIHELVDYGALVFLKTSPPEPPVFSAACITPLRTACGLRLDYDLDLFTAGVLIGYLIQIETLERQVQSLRAQLPASVVSFKL